MQQLLKRNIAKNAFEECSGMSQDSLITRKYDGIESKLWEK